MRKTTIGILALGLALFLTGSAQATLWLDEIGWDGTETGDPVVGSRDFIEIWNDSANPVGISSLFISDGRGKDLNWAAGTIPAWGFWVIVDGAGTDQTVGDILYTFEGNKAAGGALSLPGTDGGVAVSPLDTGGLETGLADITDFVAYTDGTNTPATGVWGDVNAVITAGAWDLYGTGSTADPWSGTDSQPGVIIIESFIRRIAEGRDTPGDYATRWEASTTAGIGSTQIPEPATLILLGTGLLSLVGYAKKKKMV